jgi:hypothetical protein
MIYYDSVTVISQVKTFLGLRCCENGELGREFEMLGKRLAGTALM